MSIKFAKKIYVAMVVLGVFNYSLMYANANISKVNDLAMQSSVIPNYNSMIKECALSIKSEYIKYNDEKVMFFANPSTRALILNSLNALGSSIAGLGIILGGGMFLYDAKTKNQLDAKLLVASALLAPIPIYFLTYSLHTGVKTIVQLSAKLSTVPYVTLSKDGLCCYNTHVFSWDQLAKIDFTSFIKTNRSGTTSVQKKTATMKDHSGEELFEVSSDILTSDIDVFVQCAEYYYNQSLHKKD